LSSGLFQRIDKVYESRLNPGSKYSKEQVLLIERVHLDFVRAGAKFDAEAQLKYGKIMENLAVLTTKFAQV
jgi:peptidyl-dipeptidase Dcp